MSALIVCRALKQTPPPEDSRTIELLAAFCAQALRDARRDGRPVVHYFTRWPTDAALLKGCGARADEPMFTGPFGALYGSEPLCRHLKNANIRDATLIGLIDAQILAATLDAAPRQQVAFTIDPALIGILEPAGPGSLLS